MRASFKKRLKWYGGIFLLGLLVFAVNIIQLEKARDTFKTKSTYVCNNKYFYAMQRDVKPTMAEQLMQGLTPFRKKRMLDGLEPKQQTKPKSAELDSMFKKPEATELDSLFKKPKKKNKYAHVLTVKQALEAEKQYQKCVSERRAERQEARSKKIWTENSLGVGSFLMAFTVFLSIMDFIIFLFRNRKLKLKTGEVTAMENKKITKIAILIFIVWGIISFLIAQSGYRHRFQIDTFLILNIPSILFMGYLWVTDKFTLK